MGKLESLNFEFEDVNASSKSKTNHTNNRNHCPHRFQLMFQAVFIEIFKECFTCHYETCLQVIRALFNSLYRMF